MAPRPPIPLPQTLALESAPKPVHALCARLEEAGIAAFLQGECVLDAWLGGPPGRAPGRAVVCLAPPEAVLSALPPRLG